MSDNDIIRDHYGASEMSSEDFEKFYFEEIDDDNLFWMKNTNQGNMLYRKLNENQAVNIKKNTTHDIHKRLIVYQRI